MDPPAAEDAGLKPIQINIVIVYGVNDDALTDPARLTIDHDWPMRFIELMPVGDQTEGGRWPSR